MIFEQKQIRTRQVYNGPRVAKLIAAIRTRQVLQWTPGSQIHCSNQKIILSKK